MYVQLREHLSSLEVGNEGLGMNQGLNAFTGSIVRQFLLTKLNYSANVNMSGFILKLSKKKHTNMWSHRMGMIGSMEWFQFIRIYEMGGFEFSAFGQRTGFWAFQINLEPKGTFLKNYGFQIPSHVNSVRGYLTFQYFYILSVKRPSVFNVMTRYQHRKLFTPSSRELY